MAKLEHRQSAMIMGAAIGLATVAVAIDATRHPLPKPEPAVAQPQQPGETPCGMEAPCGLSGEESPCGMGESPCGLEGGAPCDLAPCSLDDAAPPCGLGDEPPCGLG
ncbi:MAG TPA: hypothetical protein ENJ05_06755 [Thiotrichales bacterium]|nr:hypothetical protein [Thiotrichales bacterium]